MGTPSKLDNLGRVVLITAKVKPVSFSGSCPLMPSKEVRAALSGFLSGLGAIVHECSNADDALELVVRLQPALVVSDIAMPDKDGFELLQEIRSLDLSGKVPVIAITGLSRPLDQMRAPAAGFDALLLKPFTPDALVRAISEVLEA